MLNSERFIHAIQRESGADEEEEMYLRCGSGVSSLHSVPIRNGVGEEKITVSCIYQSRV